MSNSAILLVALAILAHLVADFVLQTDAIAEAKSAQDGRAWRGLGIHVAIVAACLLPFALAFGGPGLEYLVVVALAHGLIDRTKVLLNRRAIGTSAPSPSAAGQPTGVEKALPPDAPAIVADRRSEPDAPGDRAWSPLPAALFLADQVAHFVVFLAGATGLLLGQPTLAAWSDAVNAIEAHLLPVGDPVPAVIVLAVVLDLLIINIRGGFFLVGTLLAPRGFTSGAEPGPERIGATIGILERLIVCALVLAGQAAAIGLVIAAKTLARFRQLDDRHFAEYYLVGTLASVTLALSTSLIAAAAITAALA